MPDTFELLAFALKGIIVVNTPTNATDNNPLAILPFISDAFSFGLLDFKLFSFVYLMLIFSISFISYIQTITCRSQIFLFAIITLILGQSFFSWD